MLKVVGRRVVALFAAIGRGNGWPLGLTATVRTTSPGAGVAAPLAAARHAVAGPRPLSKPSTN
jgi:hypothetical protein